MRKMERFVDAMKPSTFALMLAVGSLAAGFSGALVALAIHDLMLVVTHLGF